MVPEVAPEDVPDDVTHHPTDAERRQRAVCGEGAVPVDVAGISMHRPGTIVGKALEPLASGEGEVLVLLSLQ